MKHHYLTQYYISICLHATQEHSRFLEAARHWTSS